MTDETRHVPRRGLRRFASSARGQGLVELALVLPVLFALVGGIIQFGLIFWGQNTLTQIVRDTGRWAATQTDCTATAAVITTANQIAGSSSMIGYQTGTWVSGSGTAVDTVAVAWVDATGKTPSTPGADVPCPPVNNQKVWWVTITITEQVPVFFPFVPGDGKVSSSTRFRVEPSP